MSIYAMVWAYEQEIKNSGAKFTLVTAAQYCNDEGICWVKQATLAQDMSMDRRSVMRHLDGLEKAKLIERVERRRKDGTRASDLIKLVGFRKVTKSHSDDQQGDKNDTDQGDKLSQQETSVNETSLNPTGGTESRKPPKPKPLDKHITDTLYDRMKATGMRWTKEEYGFHISRVQEMLAKDEPTDEELEELPGALVDLFAFQAKGDAVSALREIRRKRRRGELIEERERERQSRREEIAGEAAPWERPNPHGERKSTLSEKELARRRREQDELLQMMANAKANAKANANGKTTTD